LRDDPYSRGLSSADRASTTSLVPSRRCRPLLYPFLFWNGSFGAHVSLCQNREYSQFFRRRRTVSGSCPSVRRSLAVFPQRVPPLRHSCFSALLPPVLRSGQRLLRTLSGRSSSPPVVECPVFPCSPPFHSQSRSLYFLGAQKVDDRSVQDDLVSPAHPSPAERFSFLEK